MTPTQFILFISMIGIAFGLPIVACIESKRLGDGKKAFLIITGIMFLAGAYWYALSLA